MRIFQLIGFLFILLYITSCATKKHKNISYLPPSTSNNEQPTLNIFTPKKSKNSGQVLLFVHGGNWNSGNKNMYSFLGRHFAKKGITTVIVGYTLSPKVNYNTMATQVGKAVEWTKANIEKYNGNPDHIFLTGHSAGGHLIALVGTNPKYLKDNSIIKGIILNDAAALDMKHYLEEFPPTDMFDYKNTWTMDPKEWENASPIYFLNKNSPPFMIYLGSRTYESITVANERFLAKLNTFQPNVKAIILDKSHFPMMLQYLFSSSERYDEIIDFMQHPK
jgi:arylformamidase